MEGDHEAEARSLERGMRVRVRDEALQAFYGIYGTLIAARHHQCGGTDVTFVDVWMDDLPHNEGHATFYLDQVELVGDTQVPR